MLELKSFKGLKEKLLSTDDLFFEQLPSSLFSLLTSFSFNTLKKDILLISTTHRKDLFFEDLLFFQKTSPIEFFLSDAIFDEKMESKDSLGRRYEALKEIALKKEQKILICPLLAAIQKIPAKEDILSALQVWKKGTKLNELEKTLFSLGYKKVSTVSEKGEFSLRGAILDLFSPSSTHPHRVEIFEEEIESIRLFDPSSQKSIEKVKEILICPTNELKAEAYILDYLSSPLVIFDDLLGLEDTWAKIKSSFASDPLHTFFLKAQENRKFYFSKEKEGALCEEKNEGIDIFNLKLKAKKVVLPSFFLPEDLELPDAKLNLLYETQKEKDILENRFKAHKEKFFMEGYLSEGFFLPLDNIAYIPAVELTHHQKLRRQIARNINFIPASEYHQLESGDTVVHFHSGIARFLGIEKQKDIKGKETEFLVLEYAEKSRLLVPLSQAHLVSRYIGSKEEKPILSQLGGKKWQTAKVQAQKKITGYAFELLNLYAERSLEKGFQYPEDSDEVKIFELDFPYCETIDQLKAVREIKEDMRSDKAMDRLILGDVGYGKTEVAMRAAFKAVVDGQKQVVVLVPTTVLAQQHYETFSTRMANYPLSIEVVSRFHAEKKNKEILKMVKDGKVDILIGTHRVLSKDVSFSNLGLIIIDEEQRFGVRSKEHLKKLKKNVDCLSMSATPIPRTLYMSLMKIKDMSAINTPPQDRLPVKTIISTSEEAIIKNAITNELAREGQLFFIHNRVETIAQKADYIKSLVPHATIITVHGQMESDKLDNLFHLFKEHKADILVATTIIENGIDIPNANTIIIDRAHTFGLADLYQLRGRVGRWNRSAFAYLLVPKNEMSEIAQKRLFAFLESGGLGSGMKIAMRDLEIRGAGDILGARQSGQISNIGFHLYCKLLKKTVNALKLKAPISFEEVKLEFSFPAFIPESYIPELELRMEFYHRLGSAESEKEIDEIIAELKDRFGQFPEELLWLYHLSRLRFFLNQNLFSYLKFLPHSLYAEQKSGKKSIKKSILLPHKLDPSHLDGLIVDLLKKNFEF